jgi:hypothetical protein
MNRFLISTAVGLFLGATPALSQDQAPQDQSLSPPAAQAPADPADAPSVINSSEAPSVIDNSMSSSAEAPVPQSSEAAPQSIAPPDKSALREAPSAGSDRFLKAQQSNDYLASNLIGETVVNAKNETIGEVNDLVTDKDGKIVAVLIGAGGFLGIGEKDVAVPFQDLNIARDANNELTLMLNIDQDTIAAAPDYQRLDEQQVVEGSNKTDREDKTRTY